MVRRTCVALTSIAFLAGFPTIAASQAKGTSNRPAGWVLTKQVDKMTDAQSFTIVRKSNDGRASLGIHCSDGSFTAFLAVPKTVQAGELTFAEVRFDKQEPVGFTLRRFDEALLVSMIGGLKTHANYVFMTDDAQKAVAGTFSADETARMGMRVAKAAQSSSQMIYRFSLAGAGLGTEATFNLSGFTQTAAPMLKGCPIQ